MNKENVDIENKPFLISIGDNIKDIAISHVEFSWDKLTAVIRNPIKRHVSYDKYAENEHEPHDKVIAKLLKSEKSDLQYFVGGYFESLQRRNENIRARTLIVLDIDSYNGSIEELKQKLKQELNQYRYLAYSTVSHRKDAPCIRVILQNNKEIHPDIYKVAVENLIDKLSFKSAIDINASATVSQAMYLPAIIKVDEQPSNVSRYEYEYWFDENSGSLVDIDDYCSEAIGVSTVRTTNRTALKEYNHLPVSDQQVLECLANYPAKALDFHGWMEVCMALHYNYRGSEAGYRILDEWSSQDVEKYNESKNRQLWDGIKDNVANPKTFASILKKVQNIKSDDWQRDIVSKIRDLSERFDEEGQLMPIIRGIAMYCSETESEYYVGKIKDVTKLSINVLRGLIKKEHKKIAIEKAKSLENKIFNLDEELPRAMFPDFVDSDKPPKTTLPNFKVILRGYGISIKRNLISREEEIEIPGQNYCADTKLNASYNDLISLCEMNGLNKTNLINGYCGNIGNRNVYNPALDLIKSKPWDGKSRLQDILDTIVVKKGYDESLKSIIVKKWLTSAIAVLCEEKGTKTKGVLIFQGGQSARKSFWFEKLVPKELKDFYTEGLQLNTLDKDSVAIANSCWLVELGEFEGSLTGRQISSLKAFFSNDKSVLRRAYAAKNETLYRRSAFCGTVNPQEFLKDRTGNVRYWPIAVENLLSTDHIDKQQLWAEMLNYYEVGDSWHLTPEEEAMLEKSNECFLEVCPYEEVIRQYIKPYSQDIKTCPEDNKKTATQILMKIRGPWGLNVNIDQKGTRAVVSALNRLGVQRELGNKKRFYIETV